MAHDRQYWLDRPGSTRKVTWAVYAICTLLLLSDLLYHKHPYFEAEGWFGFYGLFGFLACSLLVLVARTLRPLLKRGEDYYDR